MYFPKNVRHLFIFATCAILSGYVLDTIVFYDVFSRFINIINAIVFATNLIILLLVLNNKVNIEIGYLIIIYTTLSGILVVSIYDLFNGALITHLLVRNIILFPLVIYTIGFVVNKKQMVYASVVIAVLFPAVLLASGVHMLMDFAPFVSIMTVLSALAMNLFLSSLEKSIEENLIKERELADKNSELELLNKNKNNLLSVISHDLIGPIGVTQQTVKYLMEEELPEEDKKFLIQIVDSSLDNIYNVLNNLLLWARNEQGVMKSTPENLNVHSIVCDTISFLQKEAQVKSICISNAVIPSIKSYSDKLLLETTLRNLVSNAIKYTNENGSIWITSTIVENMCVISVKDNGIGISEENKKRIFVDYKGITRLGTKNEKGSGLGLKICKEFVQKNGGEIWVKSEIGIGTEFLFSIPKEKNEV